MLRHRLTSIALRRSISTSFENKNHEKYFIKDKYTKLTRDEVFKLGTTLASNLQLGNKALKNEKVAILSPNNYAYAISLLATWLNGGVALGKGGLIFKKKELF